MDFIDNVGINTSTKLDSEMTLFESVQTNCYFDLTDEVLDESSCHELVATIDDMHRCY